MEQTPKHNTESMKTANQTSIYQLLVVGIIVSILGVYLRFAGDSSTLSIISWVILFAGAFICCKAVFKILAA
ncbi:hypothetical protein [Pedobacter nutrimenti]|uniref:hypothetical protein n=1 Tax=Pedobacter nutrimenti TaxID=1241337 RepID=UPI00292CE904|nr:hypothetical protein [Pedobacter nutrimenti]